jgi:muconolactone delta-isomerase
MLKRLLLSLLVAFPGAAVAGGSSFACRVLTVDEGRAEELRVTLKADLHDSYWVPSGDPVVLHIRYPNGGSKRAKVDPAAIERLRAAQRAGSPTQLSIMGGSLESLAGTPGHYRTYGLVLLEENSGDTVVFTFNKPQ